MAGYVARWFTYTQTVTDAGTNQARHRVTQSQNSMRNCRAYTTRAQMHQSRDDNHPRQYKSPWIHHSFLLIPGWDVKSATYVLHVDICSIMFWVVGRVIKLSKCQYVTLALHTYVMHMVQKRMFDYFALPCNISTLLNFCLTDKFIQRLWSPKVNSVNGWREGLLEI